MSSNKHSSSFFGQGAVEIGGGLRGPAPPGFRQSLKRNPHLQFQPPVIRGLRDGSANCEPESRPSGYTACWSKYPRRRCGIRNRDPPRRSLPVPAGSRSSCPAERSPKSGRDHRASHMPYRSGSRTAGCVSLCGRIPISRSSHRHHSLRGSLAATSTRQSSASLVAPQRAHRYSSRVSSSSLTRQCIAGSGIRSRLPLRLRHLAEFFVFGHLVKQAVHTSIVLDKRWKTKKNRALRAKPTLR